jgi:hypothetical protein
MCRIHLRRSVDIGDRASWPEQHEWLRQKLELLHRAFAPRVKQLSDEGAPPGSDGTQATG